MAIDFAVERGDLQLNANYTEPLFALWRETEQLFQRLFAGLSKYGLRLTDLKWDQAANSVGDVQLNFYLFNFAVAVRIRIDRLEVELFDIKKVTADQLEEAVLELVAALRMHKPEIAFSAYSVAIGYHGRLADTTARAFTAQLTTAPEPLGASTGAGAVFYYGPQEGRTSSAITADLSGVVADALFFRTFVIWDGSQVPINEVRARMSGYMERVLNGFGLNMPAPQL